MASARKTRFCVVSLTGGAEFAGFVLVDDLELLREAVFPENGARGTGFLSFDQKNGETVYTRTVRVESVVAVSVSSGTRSEI